MFNRKLKKRIQSLEDYLGLRYCEEETNNSSAEHLTDGYGLTKQIEKLVEERRKSLKQ